MSGVYRASILPQALILPRAQVPRWERGRATVRAQALRLPLQAPGLPPLLPGAGRPD